MAGSERAVPRFPARDICALLGGRDDKYCLYGMGNLTYHARSPDEDSSLGFPGKCVYLTYDFSRMLSISMSEGSPPPRHSAASSPLELLRKSLTWHPDRMLRSFEWEGKLFVEENRFIHEETLVSRMSIENKSGKSMSLMLEASMETTPSMALEALEKIRVEGSGSIPGFTVLLARDKSLKLCRIAAMYCMEAGKSSNGDEHGRLALRIDLEPCGKKTVVAGLHICDDTPGDIRFGCTTILSIIEDPMKALIAVRERWNRFFNDEIPRFECSDPYYEALYYYRWYSLHGKMLFPSDRGFRHPACREGTAFANSVIPFSTACAMLDLRWKKDTSWAYGSALVMFENMNAGHLANHIYVDRRDGDANNRDASGADFPYHNYATWALWQTHLVHPAPDILRELYPKLVLNINLYEKCLDIDGDGLYETYPWGSLSGMEWMSRFLYLHPLEALRYIPPWGFGYQYRPDESTAEQDVEWSYRIEKAVVHSPRIAIPHDAASIRKMYYEDTLYYRQETVDLNSFAYLEFFALSEIARQVGKPADAEAYRSLAEATASEVRDKMWDSRDGFFYDLSPLSHEKARVMTPVGFYPFFAGIARVDQLRIFDHLFDPRKFWTTYPVPTIAMDYPKLDKLREYGWIYWNYGNWPMTTSHVCDAVAKAAKLAHEEGHAGARRLLEGASELFDRYVRVHFADGDLKRIEIVEWYDPHEGRISGSPGPTGQDYCHSYFIDLLVRHIVGLEPEEGFSDRRILRLRPLPGRLDFFRLAGVNYRGREITVEYRKPTSESGATLTGYSVYMDGNLMENRPELGFLEVAV